MKLDFVRIATISAALILIPSAMAAEQEPTSNLPVPPLRKLSFAVKHPKLHKIGRGFRRSCQVSLPVLQAAACVSQTLYPFIR